MPEGTGRIWGFIIKPELEAPKARHVFQRTLPTNLYRPGLLRCLQQDPGKDSCGLWLLLGASPWCSSRVLLAWSQESKDFPRNLWLSYPWAKLSSGPASASVLILGHQHEMPFSCPGWPFHWVVSQLWCTTTAWGPVSELYTWTRSATLASSELAISTHPKRELFPQSIIRLAHWALGHKGQRRNSGSVAGKENKRVIE